jgi:hypothetical protein
MFDPMIPMTSLTCACCVAIFLAAWICLICSGPGIGFPSGPRGRSFFSSFFSGADMTGLVRSYGAGGCVETSVD